MIPDLLKLLSDKKMMKNVQSGLLLLLAAAFWVYHQLVIRPQINRIDRTTRLTWQLVRATNLNVVLEDGR